MNVNIKQFKRKTRMLTTLFKNVSNIVLSVHRCPKKRNVHIRNGRKTNSTSGRLNVFEPTKQAPRATRLFIQKRHWLQDTVGRTYSGSDLKKSDILSARVSNNEKPLLKAFIHS